jgi:hypothetical protein
MRNMLRSETGSAKSIVSVGRHPGQKKAVPYTDVGLAGRKLVASSIWPPEKVARPTVSGG